MTESNTNFEQDLDDIRKLRSSKVKHIPTIDKPTKPDIVNTNVIKEIIAKHQKLEDRIAQLEYIVRKLKKRGNVAEPVYIYKDKKQSK